MLDWASQLFWDIMKGNILAPFKNTFVSAGDVLSGICTHDGHTSCLTPSVECAGKQPVNCTANLCGFFLCA